MGEVAGDGWVKDALAESKLLEIDWTAPKPAYHRPRMRIVNDSGIGRNTKIFIDDVDVSGCFADVRITAGVKDVVVAQLEAILVEVEFEGVERLMIPFAGTRELLIKYGWTPPAEDDIIDAEIVDDVEDGE